MTEPKFGIGDLVAYDENFGEVIGIRPGIDRRAGYDFLVRYENGYEGWSWDSDLCDGEERLAELEYWDCSCDLYLDQHQRECV